MVVSTAFAELAEVLRRFEHRNLELHEISVVEESLEEVEELTAMVTVGIPVLDGVAPQDNISIEAPDGAVSDGGFTVELSVSVSTTAGSNKAASESFDSPVGGSHLAAELVQTANGGVPAYKDPEALRAVYEQYDSFPEMTDALGVDVTSETVRRYMVQFDIHDPEGEDLATDGETADEMDTGASPDESVEQEPDVEATIGSPGERQSTPKAAGQTAEPPADRSVAAVLAENEPTGTDDRQVTDGSGVSADLTVSQMFHAVESSRTVYEVAQRIEIEMDQTRHLLSELGLLKYVTGRLGNTPTEIPDDVRTRLLGYDERPGIAD